MKRYTYQPMDTAPKTEPIIAVCSGVEMAVIWGTLGTGIDGPDPGRWYYFDEDEGGNTWERVRDTPSGWRRMDWGITE